MFKVPWVCRKCIIALLKPTRCHQGRFLSNGVPKSIPPALLKRARALAQEHDKLKNQAAEAFDSRISKRIGELQNVRAVLKDWEDTESSLSELNSLLKDPTTDQELRELAAEELVSTTARLDVQFRNLAIALTPKHPFAELPCLLEIRPGVGGDEAALFAGDLLRMYRAYCSRRGLRASLLKYEDADGASGGNGNAPLQEAILEVETPGAYGNLRGEAGVHRVQRVPATESKGRTHTSAVSVLVLPSFPTSRNDGGAMSEANFNDPNNDYYINPQDIRTDVMRARGAGGQHVNTTDSAIRLTHIPTNTVVSMQDSRSQHQNREKAWMVLRSRLAQARREAREEEMMRLRRSVVGVASTGRGDKIRTYSWGQQRVTDHRSGLSVHNLDDVMEGGDGLDKIVQSVKNWMSERDIENLVLEEANKEKFD